MWTTTLKAKISHMSGSGIVSSFCWNESYQQHIFLSCTASFHLKNKGARNRFIFWSRGDNELSTHSSTVKVSKEKEKHLDLPELVLQIFEKWNTNLLTALEGLDIQYEVVQDFLNGSKFDIQILKFWEQEKRHFTICSLVCFQKWLLQAASCPKISFGVLSVWMCSLTLSPFLVGTTSAWLVSKDIGTVLPCVNVHCAKRCSINDRMSLSTL